MRIISGLSEIAPAYDVLLCDVWGVIRDGRALLPEALDALSRFREGGGRVALVSNSPRPSGDLRSQLARLGAPDGPWDATATSGDAIRAALSERAPGPAFRIGPDWDAPLYEGIDLDFSGLEAARFVSCSGLNDDDAETPDDYRDVLERMRKRDLVMVCANPDIVVQVGDRLVWCAGALARAYRELGGETVIAGKPHRPIYDLALTRLEKASGRPVDPARTLAIGDGPETDLAGAASIGVDALFIAEGILGGAFTGAGFDADAVSAALRPYGVAARYAAPRLVW